MKVEILQAGMPDPTTIQDAAAAILSKKNARNNLFIGLAIGCIAGVLIGIAVSNYIQDNKSLK